MYLISFYVPSSDKEKVKDAMFRANAGRVGRYGSCSFELKGTGQFCPLSGSSPYIGSEGKIEKVEEYRVEMVCEDEYIDGVIKAMKASHPYEEVAFSVLKMCNENLKP